MPTTNIMMSNQSNHANRESVYTPVLKERSLDEQPRVLTPAAIANIPGVLLLPGGDINENQVLAVTAISSIFDMADFVNPEETVILSIADGNTLRCVLTNPDIFGKHFYVLEGYPGFEYRDYFTNATWGLPRVSYHSLAAEVNFARELNEKSKLATQSVIEKEKRRSTRKTGFRKPFSEFDVEVIGGPSTAEPSKEIGDEPDEQK